MNADRQSLPVLTIGGYLGSGKTTLVNHLLRNAGGRRLAVLVNEFGELPIDEDLIEAEDDSLISIAGGCICCSFGNDLVGALQNLGQLDPPPDHVIIESSGVAIPGAIVATMSLLPGFRSEGIVVVVDGETVQGAAADDYIGDTILRQLADAEIVVINKSDLLDARKNAELPIWLADRARHAALLPAQFGRVPPEAILGMVANPGTGRPGEHSDDLFDSFTLVPDGATDAEALVRALATGDFGVMRAKGYVTGSDGTTWLIQSVGKRWSADPAGKEHDPGVVCLGFRSRLAKEKLSELGRRQKA